MLDKLGRRAREETGVILVMVAIMMTVFLGMAALAIDIGSFYGAQRKAQSAADAAALAAAGDLTKGTAVVNNDVTTYVNQNYPGATVSSTTPYNGSASQIKVNVSSTSPSFFGHIFGFTQASITASAVAGATATGTPAAVFAYNATCGSNSGLVLGTNGGLTIPAGVHSNGSITASNSGAVYGPSTYGGPNNCSFNPNSGTSNNGTCVNSYNSACAPTASSTLQPYPADYRTTWAPAIANDPTKCTFSGSDKNFQNQSGAVLANGTYCYSTIEFNSSNMTCTCTFWASQGFQFNNTNNNFTPYVGNLTFYYSGTGNLNINSNGNSWLLNGGTIFAPTASVTINSPSNTTVSGFVEALDVILNGNGPTTWTGTGPGAGGGAGGAVLLQ